MSITLSRVPNVRQKYSRCLPVDCVVNARLVNIDSWYGMPQDLQIRSIRDSLTKLGHTGAAQQEPSSGAFAAHTNRGHGTSRQISWLSPNLCEYCYLAIDHGFSRPLRDSGHPSQLGQRNQLSRERWSGTGGTQRSGSQSTAATGRARSDATGEIGGAARNTEAV